jgi:hypothetical protein
MIDAVAECIVNRGGGGVRGHETAIFVLEGAVGMRRRPSRVRTLLPAHH